MCIVKYLGAKNLSKEVVSKSCQVVQITLDWRDQGPPNCFMSVRLSVCWRAAPLGGRDGLPGMLPACLSVRLRSRLPAFPPFPIGLCLLCRRTAWSDGRAVGLWKSLCVTSKPQKIRSSQVSLVSLSLPCIAMSCASSGRKH